MEIIIILSLIGTLLSVYNNITPIIAIFARIKTQELDQIPILYLQLNHVCQLSWLIYSLMISSIELAIVNTVVTVLSSVGLFLHIINTGSMNTFLPNYLFVTVASSGLALRYLDSAVQGLVCIGISIAASVSTLQTVQNAFTQKDSGFIDINMAYSGTLSTVAWTIYGAYTSDINVFTCNLMGTLLGVCLILVHYYIKFNKIKA
jgi:uncharacterized protein with PQ loop repeat